MDYYSNRKARFMMKGISRYVFVEAVAILMFASASQAAVVEHLLGEPKQYNLLIGPQLLAGSSLMEVYVENVFAPERWKDWDIEFWVSVSEGDIDSIVVKYDNSVDHSAPVETFSISLAPVGGDPPWPGMKGFYASTWEAAWEQYGTTPVGGQGSYPIGNPQWVSFHVDRSGANGPLGYYIEDSCIPEPATIALIGLGALVTLTRRSTNRQYL